MVFAIRMYRNRTNLEMLCCANLSRDNVYVDRWPVLRRMCNLIGPPVLPGKPNSRWVALRHMIEGAGRAIVPFRKNVIVLLPNLELDGEILLLGRAGALQLLRCILGTRQPAFVFKGSLERVGEQFGLDRQDNFRLHITSSGLALLFGNKSGKAVAVHAALSLDRRRLIKQLCIGTAIGAEALPEYVPAIVEQGSDHIATRRIEGHALMPWGKSEKDLQAAILMAFEPLRQLHSRRNPSRTPDSDYIRVLSRFVQRHQYRNELSIALDVVEHWDRFGLGSVTVHGDYWLNNVIGLSNRVSGILDWDRARRDGSPAFDALHLGFMSYAMWADKYVSELLASLWTGSWEYPWLEQYTKRIAETFAMSLSALQGAAALLWLSYFYHEADVAPPAEWYVRMIEPVCRALSSRGTANSAPTSQRMTLDS